MRRNDTRTEYLNKGRKELLIFGGPIPGREQYGPMPLPTESLPPQVVYRMPNRALETSLAISLSVGTLALIADLLS
jgi:hypothetical protein